MMSSADLGAGVVSVPLGCAGSLVQIHLHVHADADQDCTIDLAVTDDGVQVRLRGVYQDALRLDDEDQASADADDPIDIDVEDLLGRWGGEKADNEAAATAAEEEEAFPAEQVGDEPEIGVVEDSTECVYLGKPFDWTIAERVDDGVVFTRGERELFHVPEERFEEMRQLFVLEDTGLITMHVDGFRVVREGGDACIFEGETYFERIPKWKFALMTRLFT